MELYGLTQKGQHLDFELSQIGGTYETEDVTITLQAPADVPDPIEIEDQAAA